MQREQLSEQIAARAAELSTDIGQQQVEKAALILLPVLTGEVAPAGPLHFSY